MEYKRSRNLFRIIDLWAFCDEIEEKFLSMHNEQDLSSQEMFKSLWFTDKGEEIHAIDAKVNKKMNHKSS